MIYRGALKAAPHCVPANAEVQALTFGKFDGLALAIAAGNEVAMVRATEYLSEIARVRLASRPVSLAAGNFSGDARPEIVALDEDGQAYMIERTTKGRKAKAVWRARAMEADRASRGASLVAGNLSSGANDELLMVDAANQRIHAAGKADSAPASRLTAMMQDSGNGQAVVVVPAPVDKDAVDDLIVFGAQPEADGHQGRGRHDLHGHEHE